MVHLWITIFSISFCISNTFSSIKLGDGKLGLGGLGGLGGWGGFDGWDLDFRKGKWKALDDAQLVLAGGWGNTFVGKTLGGGGGLGSNFLGGWGGWGGWDGLDAWGGSIGSWGGGGGWGGGGWGGKSPTIIFADLDKKKEKDTGKAWDFLKALVNKPKKGKMVVIVKNKKCKCKDKKCKNKTMEMGGGQKCGGGGGWGGWGGGGGSSIIIKGKGGWGGWGIGGWGGGGGGCGCKKCGGCQQCQQCQACQQQQVLPQVPLIKKSPLIIKKVPQKVLVIQRPSLLSLHKPKQVVLEEFISPLKKPINFKGLSNIGGLGGLSALTSGIRGGGGWQSLGWGSENVEQYETADEEEAAVNSLKAEENDSSVIIVDQDSLQGYANNEVVDDESNQAGDSLKVNTN